VVESYERYAGNVLLVAAGFRRWLDLGEFLRPPCDRSYDNPTKRFVVGRMQLRPGAQEVGNANSSGQRYGEMSSNPSPRYFDGQ
jgi:hypothetical protein